MPVVTDSNLPLQQPTTRVSIGVCRWPRVYVQLLQRNSTNQNVVRIDHEVKKTGFDSDCRLNGRVVHVKPALARARALCRRVDGNDLKIGKWIGRRCNLEEAVVRAMPSLDLANIGSTS
jgi:hypothetical protein